MLARPDATLAEHAAYLADRTGVRLSPSRVGRLLATLGLPLKKTLVARERDEAARAAWRVAMPRADPADLVFLDETATPTTLTPTRARAPREQRAIGQVPRGRREAVSWLATLTPAGIGESLVVAGAVDRVVFDAFVERRLVPSLRPGQVVVLDNLWVHKSARAHRAIEAARCRLVFLPTYSPDFNPIELAFATCKQRLRPIQPRSIDAVVGAVGQALTGVTPAAARSFYRAAGYPM